MLFKGDPLGMAPGSIVVDLGSAGGELSARLRELGYTVVAIEPDAQLAPRSGARSATCMALGEAMPVRSGAADAALVIEVLEHVADPPSVLEELSRILRPGGRIIVAVPTDYTERLYRKLHPRYEINSTHLHVFSRVELEEFLRRSGFVVEQCRTENLAPALAWIVHSVLRTEADHTGTVRSRRWVDLASAGLVRLWAALPLLRRARALLAERFGKSWYFLGYKSP